MKILLVLTVLCLMPFVLGMSTCGGGFTQAQVDMAAARAGEIAYAKAHDETKKKLTEVYLKLGATQAEAEAKAELDATAAGEAARSLADLAARKAMPVAPPTSGNGGLLGILGTVLLNFGLSAAESKWGRG